MIKCESLYLLALNTLINPEFSLVKNALNLGAITGIFISIIQLLLLFLGFGDSSYLQWIIYISLILSILWGSRTYRDLACEGYISYSQSLGFGLMLSFGAALVFSFFLYIYMKYVDHAYISEVLNQMEVTMYESEVKESEIEMIMKIYRSYLTPGAMAVGMVFTYFFIGGLISLITSIFVKNPKTEF
ncbi:MAG TPA: hypothetical protein DCX54_00895 [Flavobacteriales bacterium]|nr:hypothetical protein [Flavobacteriales bacterium]